MEQHAGAVIEKAVRRSGISIAALARRINVNRRSVYNWFQQETLSIDIIYRIGQAIGYDFSADLPEFMNTHRYYTASFQSEREVNPEESISYWKNKYIGLLEKYNSLLVQQADLVLAEDNHAA